MCVYGTGSDLMREAFLKGLNLVYGSGDYYRKTLSISLADCVLEIFPNQQWFFKNSLKVIIYLFILLETAPLVSLYFPWSHVFQVFRWAHGVGLAHSSSRKAALITILFLLTFLDISCTNAEINSPTCDSGLRLPVCFYRTLSPKKTT